MPVAAVRVNRVRTRSAELSEAINSMFSWYEQAEICYAYPSDVSSNTGTFELDQLTNSRWFTRGWNLQELIAPRKADFYSSTWDLLGSRDSLGPEPASRPSSCAMASPCTSSASFGISMPLLYGEGQGAFVRPQEEIMRHSDDHTIFAWELFGRGPSDATREPQGLLASKPELFARSDDVVAVETGESLPFSQTNRRIQIQLRVFEEDTTLYAVLHCRKDHAASLLAIPLTSFPGNLFQRNLAARPKWIMYEEWRVSDTS
ncbi:hypothetical protein B0T18DRAFT_387721 [Schizothecium vesticola]|uniref:DUF8212 domain-containing protein n=1 Tax=Schizothecium vesticola TaxID=314040 RepID=A0AA40F6A7_9PEZI|nr:hypothetical protein B0T18DRAFT_387721 [Schizothecium vesticola]